MLVLSTKTDHAVYELHALKPGESLLGLPYKNSARLAMRVTTRAGSQTTEYDLHDSAPWQAIACWVEDQEGQVEVVREDPVQQALKSLQELYDLATRHGYPQTALKAMAAAVSGLNRMMDENHPQMKDPRRELYELIKTLHGI